MNTLKLITLSISVILSLAILIFSIYFLTRKFKSRFNNDGRLKTSFGILYAALFISGSNVISIILITVAEIIDNIIKINPAGFYLTLIRSVSLVIGTSFIWFGFWFFITQFIVNIIKLKVDEHQEMEDDNFSYFIIKAAILTGIIFSLSSLLSLILRTFIPNVEIPFYH